jgi:hypothetical protein
LHEEGADLFIGGLAEVSVEGTYGSEVLWRVESVDLVGLVAEIVACGDGRDRDSYDDVFRDGTKGADGCTHRSSCGEAIVDEDDGLVTELEWGLTCAVALLATVELFALAGDGGFDGGLGDVEVVDDVSVEDDGAVAGDGSHGQLFVAGCAEFADEEDIEREAEGLSDLEGHGDASAREREDDGVGLGAEMREAVSELTACVAAVFECHDLPPSA